MDQVIKDKWIAALRSGEYQQGTNHLKYGDHFCCLGVLTDLYIKEKGLTWDSKSPGSINGLSAIPSWDVVSWAGLNEANPSVIVPESIRGETGCTCDSLAQMNDRGYTFEQIADVIESQL